MAADIESESKRQNMTFSKQISTVLIPVYDLYANFLRRLVERNPMFDELRASETKPPSFYERLRPEEQASYRAMQAIVGRPENRYNRFRRLATLKTSVDEIRKFCIRGDDRDSARCLVCGICWLDGEEIGINTRQLRILIAKSKSSINGAFAKMNYVTCPSKEREIARLCRALPLLKKFPAELRQWTIRSPIAKITVAPAPVTGDPLSDASWDFEAVRMIFDIDCRRASEAPDDLDAYSASVCHGGTQEWNNLDRLLDVNS
jgi:hypothetical protein